MNAREVTPTEAAAAAALTQQWTALTHLRSEAELMQLVDELKSVVWRHRWRSIMRRLLPFLLVVAILAALSFNETIVDFVLTYFRVFLVNFVFPFVNIQRMVQIRCLAPNPFYDFSPVPASSEECQRCMGVRQPLHAEAENFSATSFHRDFLEGETPIIVHGGARNWLLENMTVQHLHDYYVTEELLRKTLACSLITDQKIGRNNNKLLLRILLDEKPGHWFALWEHCTLPQSKAFRPLFKRPTFLPPSVSIGGDEMHSWLVLGRDPKGPVPVLLPFKGSFFIFGQVRGQLRVQLQPNADCSGCVALNFTLSAGDLLLTLDHHELLLLPTGPTFSLGLGFAGEI